MIYRETGQFKTSYASDQQLFPILQDRVFVVGFLAFAFVAVPLLASEYLFLAVATLAAQFFVDWLFARIKWFTNDSSSGSVSAPPLTLFGYTIQTPVEQYLFVLAVVCVFALVARNLTRGAIGRSWMAIRDMDVAAEVIGIRPMRAKLSAFAVSSFFVGVAGALWAFIRL